MRTFDPDEDAGEAARLKPEQWMLDCLKLNPEYTSWGPREDYMANKSEGWNGPQFPARWAGEDFRTLDEYNECVNFYFEINRDRRNCQKCGGSGYHPDAQWVTESFYSHTSPFKHKTAGELRAEAVMSQFGGPGRDRKLGFDAYPSEAMLEKYGPAFRAFCAEMKIHHHWNDRITQDEVEALQEHGRLRTWSKESDHWETIPVTAEQVNAAQKGPGLGSGFGHDAINMSILCEHRCKRIGLPYRCDACDGHGDEFTEPVAHLSLVLWILHPRKGASRGVQFERVTQDDLPSIYEYLRTAAKRNAERFAKIPA